MLTAKVQVSVGDVIGVTVAAGAARRGVTARIFDPNGVTVAAFDGKSVGSMYVARSGQYSVAFGNTTVPGVTTNFNVTVAECGNGVTLLTFTDGPMEQCFGREVVTMYCNGDGSVDVWIINKSAGFFAFSAEKSELTNIPANPYQDILIKSDLGVTVYRLTTGDLRISTSNGYMFVYAG